MIVVLDGIPIEVPPELAEYFDIQQEAVATLARRIVELEAELAAKRKDTP